MIIFFKNIRGYSRTKRAMTLSEILLACVLMALAFLPIIGLMTSSIKVTEQDENTQRAVRLCQEKINMVMQMPYSIFAAPSEIDSGEKKYNEITLVLGEEVFDGITYISSLKVEKYTVVYHVPTCDFSLKGKNIAKANEKTPDPSTWGWNDLTYTVDDKVKRFTVTVKWKDMGKAIEKEYTLSTLKADLRKN